MLKANLKIQNSYCSAALLLYRYAVLGMRCFCFCSRSIYCCENSQAFRPATTFFTFHAKKSPLPLFKKEGFFSAQLFLIIPLCKGGIKRGISLKNQIFLYPSLRKRDFLCGIFLIIPLC